MHNKLVQTCSICIDVLVHYNLRRSDVKAGYHNNPFRVSKSNHLQILIQVLLEIVEVKKDPHSHCNDLYLLSNPAQRSHVLLLCSIALARSLVWFVQKLAIK